MEELLETGGLNLMKEIIEFKKLSSRSCLQEAVEFKDLLTCEFKDRLTWENTGETLEKQ
ncbi:MAG: hypothetical protein MUF49_20645 [Oculatellaceae cyanobacterium Prado106]|jgi:hypothetical protein|nr:hypothetical protein [Oculatellaceae cyanobacterium Prado106]